MALFEFVNFMFVGNSVLLFRSKHLILFILLILNAFITIGQDAQWRGPNRDGKFTDTLLLKEWPEDGPDVLFVTEGIGKGFSSTVATGKLIFVTGIKDTLEYLTCLDHDGNILWQEPYGRSWNKELYC